MLILNLLNQEWKKNIRAQGFYKNLAVSIMLGLFSLYIAAIMLFIGFSLNKILEKLDSNLNPMELFNGAMLYILILGLIIRFIFQQLNTINLAPYQVLPVKRSAIINFLLLKPLLNPINYLVLFIVVPFAVKSVVGYYGGSIAFRFVLSFILVIWFNSFTATYLKRKFGSNVFSIFGLLMLFLAILVLEYFKIISVFSISKALFNYLILERMALAFSFLAVIAAYMMNRLFFWQNYYTEKFNKKNKATIQFNSELSFLKKFGIFGELISLEIKLLLRHKRTNSILIMSGFFLLYGLLFYTKEVYSHNYAMLFFVAMFMTGILMLMIGQWLISWDSRHFDCLMTRNIKIETYMNANYYLLIAFNLICFIATTPYFYFGMKIVYLHVSAFLFNTGVNVYLLMYLSTYNSKRIDLSKSSAMNYQGTTYKSFLITFPIMLLPMLVVWTISTFISVQASLWTLSIMGVIGILFRKPLINACINQFNRRKYKLAEGFRESY